jgi:glutamate/tyrosine decarboxylase-like PLP-dependent enzyme
VCRKHGLWLHGDGACGLLGAGVPETRALFKGIERADSLSFDPHKWLGVPYDCGVVLIRDFDKQRRTFSISAPYLKGIHDAPDIMDYLEYGPEMSRGFRALKLWMTLRFYGQRGLRESFAHSVGLVRHLHDRVVRHPDCQALHDPVLYLYCFQYVPAELAGKRDDPETKAMLDSLNQQVADEITRTGLALVMTTKIRGRVSIRMSVCSQRTTTGDIDETFDAVVATGRRLLHAHAK